MIIWIAIAIIYLLIPILFFEMEGIHAANIVKMMLCINYHTYIHEWK